MVEMKTPPFVSEERGCNSGDVLLSHTLEMHYHRGCSVSLPCSEWERVGPLRSDHQKHGCSIADCGLRIADWKATCLRFPKRALSNQRQFAGVVSGDRRL